MANLRNFLPKKLQISLELRIAEVPRKNSLQNTSKRFFKFPFFSVLISALRMISVRLPPTYSNKSVA